MTPQETIKAFAQKQGKTLITERVKTKKKDLTQEKIKELTIEMLTDLGYIEP